MTYAESLMSEAEQVAEDLEDLPTIYLCAKILNMVVLSLTSDGGNEPEIVDRANKLQRKCQPTVDLA